MTVLGQEHYVPALQRGNRLRLERAAARREVRSLPRIDGQRMVASLLECQPEWVAGATVFDVLCWVQRLGPVKVAPLLREAGVSDFRLVRDLTERQVGVLCEALRA